MAVTEKRNRPFQVTSQELARTEELRDAELSFYCAHVVSELEQFYPNEYDMLEYLAEGRIIDFVELSQEAEYTRHLREYGVVTVSRGEEPKFAIPVLRRYIAQQIAVKQKRATKSYVVPKEQRSRWVAQRMREVIASMRELELVIRARGLPDLFGRNSFPEADGLIGQGPCDSDGQFMAFIVTCHKSFVESIDANGDAKGKKQYFFDEIRQAYPKLWEALHRVRVYRHAQLHRALKEAPSEALRAYLATDLDGMSVSAVEDPWFTLQQRVLDALLLGIQLEMDRLS